VLDSDGIVKVFKEVRAEEFDRLGCAADTERSIYERLGALPALPRYFGIATIDETLSFIRLGVCYGQSLEDVIRAPNLLSRDDACLVIGRLAQALADLHARNVAYLDIRPENIKFDGREVYLLDVGDARTLSSPAMEVATWVHDPRYASPEVVRRGMAGTSSDIFQLGVLFHQLLTGAHPFAEEPTEGVDESYEQHRLRYALANATIPYDEHASDSLPEILSQMLRADPNERPTAEQVSKTLASSERTIMHRGRRLIPETSGKVLFPARMGIPHRGHIDFMARILELGYQLVVSLQASYALSSCDPIPKWIVLKMVGQALKAKGFDLRNVHFLCTPLYGTDEQHRLHFCLMSGMEKIVAVASGNETVHAMFADRYPIIDQHTVFAAEGEAYETRSWGARLRQAIRADDRATFRDLIAHGAEEVLTFEEMRRWCTDTPELDFAWGQEPWGRVLVTLLDEQDTLLLKRRVSAYGTPEDTILQAIGGRWIDRFARESRLELNGEERRLRYEQVWLDPERNEVIQFRLITP
jgi:nicotinamide mononucleotide adenylyltransferase